MAKLMISIKPLDAVTFVFFNDPRLKFLTFCRIIKLPFCFHLLGETFYFFSCLYYTRFSWGSSGLYLNKLPDQQDLSDCLGINKIIDIYFFFNKQ